MPLRLQGHIGTKDARISVYADIDDLKKQLNKVSKVGLGIAVNSAINKAGDKTNTIIRKKIADKYNLPTRLLGSMMGKSRSSRATLMYLITGAGAQIPIASTKRFNPKTAQKRLGVSVNTGKGAKVIRGSFIATVGTHIGVFVRKKGGTRREQRVSPTTGKKYLAQLPIRELRFPSVAHMLIGKNNRMAIAAHNIFIKLYAPRLAQQLDFQISKVTK